MRKTTLKMTRRNFMFHLPAVLFSFRFLLRRGQPVILAGIANNDDAAVVTIPFGVGGEKPVVPTLDESVYFPLIING